MFGVYFYSKMSKNVSQQASAHIVVIKSEFDSAVLLYNYCLDATNYTPHQNICSRFILWKDVR